MNIFVSNLSFNVTSDDLKTLFDEFGEVSSAKVINDKYTGKSRGFGFVEMNNDEHGKNAIEKLNSGEFDGKIISVSVSKPRTDSRPSGGGGSSYNNRRSY